MKNDFESPNNNRSASSNSLTLGTRGNARSKSLITSQPKFVPPSLLPDKNDTQEEEPFQKFLNMFRKLKQHDANIDDLQAIYLAVIYHDQNCSKIDDLEDEDEIISWFMENYLEYEPLIFSIVQKQEF